MWFKNVLLKLHGDLARTLIDAAPGGNAVFLGLVNINLEGISLFAEDQHLLVLHGLLVMLVGKNSLDVVLDLCLWLLLAVSILEIHA